MISRKHSLIQRKIKHMTIAIIILAFCVIAMACVLEYVFMSTDRKFNRLEEALDKAIADSKEAINVVDEMAEDASENELTLEEVKEVVNYNSQQIEEAVNNNALEADIFQEEMTQRMNDAFEFIRDYNAIFNNIIDSINDLLPNINNALTALEDRIDALEDAVLINDAADEKMLDRIKEAEENISFVFDSVNGLWEEVRVADNRITALRREVTTHNNSLIDAWTAIGELDTAVDEHEKALKEISTNARLTGRALFEVKNDVDALYKVLDDIDRRVTQQSKARTEEAVNLIMVAHTAAKNAGADASVLQSLESAWYDLENTTLRK